MESRGRLSLTWIHALRTLKPHLNADKKGSGISEALSELRKNIRVTALTMISNCTKETENMAVLQTMVIAPVKNRVISKNL